MVIVFKATFNNISVILWRPVLFLKEPEKATDFSQVTYNFYHKILYPEHLTMSGIRTHDFLW